MKAHHKYHLVNPSPWPLLTASSILILAVGTLLFMHKHAYGKPLLYLGAALVFYNMYVWWKDIIKEGKEDHAHSEVVRKGLSLGILLFIVSELMFFGGFFASFFKASLEPVAILNAEGWPASPGKWPPEGTQTLDAWNIPFLNTLILLLSGTTVTWAHHSLIENKQKELATALGITVLLGACFSALQVYEYYHAEFKWGSGIYASNFYMATGFHGLHVLVGTIFLFVCYLRAQAGDFIPGKGHLGFEFAAWYWHFVDVVWLFLFVFVYVWGS